MLTNWHVDEIKNSIVELKGLVALRRSLVVDILSSLRWSSHNLTASETRLTKT